MKGEWNLSDSFLTFLPLQAEDRIVINARFHAERVAAPGLILGNFGSGWYGEEKHLLDHWRWSNGKGQIVLTNPADVPVRAALHLRVRGISARPLEIRLGEVLIAAPQLDGAEQEISIGYLRIPPGQTILSLLSAAPADPASKDTRQLAVALYGFELRALSLVQ